MQALGYVEYNQMFSIPKDAT
ncbi:hypothetical protein NTG1052_120003 [Candidatus Nitrotoga sp. 1052]|nr:hypothetical protein NTG1052_120003 [Candidatus Nitrotoga sp. 1052]